MKLVHLIVFLLLSSYSFADGLDQVVIALNQKKIATNVAGDRGETTINYKVGDTLYFSCWTDWGGLEQATIDIFDARGVKINTLKKRMGYGAKFYIILNREWNNKIYSFCLNYDPEITEVKPWYFEKITFKLIQ